MFVILSIVCYIIKCLVSHQVFVILSCVCYIIPCLLYYHMFVISSCVCFIILCLLYCHTRSNLGISALLEILQSCKLDHEVALFSDWYPPARPPTHPTPLGQNWITTIGGVSRNILKWAEMCLEGILKVSVWCLEGVLREESARCLKGIKKGV